MAWSAVYGFLIQSFELTLMGYFYWFFIQKVYFCGKLKLFLTIPVTQTLELPVILKALVNGNSLTPLSSPPPPLLLRLPPLEKWKMTTSENIVFEVQFMNHFNSWKIHVREILNSSYFKLFHQLWKSWCHDE